MSSSGVASKRVRKVDSIITVPFPEHVATGDKLHVPLKPTAFQAKKHR